MRIFIDIGHPAHVHYFKNLIRELEWKGHTIIVSSRDKEVCHELLNAYRIKFFNRGRGKDSIIGKFFYMLKIDLFLLYKAIKTKPDIFLSFASPYASHVARILNKPNISLTDTENAKLGILSFVPFTDHILTPSVFNKDLGNKQIKFDSFMELCYLHSDYFKPEDILPYLNLNKPPVILRFVSWKASHDINQKGFTFGDKQRLINEILKQNYPLLISSEEDIHGDFEKYVIKLPPEKIHSLLFHAKLYIGEGATMASESALLGTPAIYVNSLNSGTIEAQQEAGLLFHYDSIEQILSKTSQILKDPNSNRNFRTRKELFLSNKINPTKYLIWFIENYPKSISLLKQNPNLQYRFL